MTNRLLIAAIVTGLLVLAIGGWTVKGLRRLGQGRGRMRLRPAYAG